jgi:hypothetical protein
MWVADQYSFIPPLLLDSDCPPLLALDWDAAFVCERLLSVCWERIEGLSTPGRRAGVSS